MIASYLTADREPGRIAADADTDTLARAERRNSQTMALRAHFLARGHPQPFPPEVASLPGRSTP
jgi:hypothetical protein